jgi:hypothetical protein
MKHKPKTNVHITTRHQHLYIRVAKQILEIFRHCSDLDSIHWCFWFFYTSEVTIFCFVYKPLESYIKFRVNILLTVVTQMTRHRKGNFLIGRLPTKCENTHGCDIATESVSTNNI